MCAKWAFLAKAEWVRLIYAMFVYTVLSSAQRMSYKRSSMTRTWPEHDQKEKLDQILGRARTEFCSVSPRNYIHIALNCFPSFVVVRNIIASRITFKGNICLSGWNTTFMKEMQKGGRGGWWVEVQDYETRARSSHPDSQLSLGLGNKSTLVKVRERLWFQ